MDHTNWQGGYPENATDAEDCVIDATEYYGDGWKVGSISCLNINFTAGLQSDPQVARFLRQKW